MKNLLKITQLLLVVSIMCVLSACESHSPEKISGKEILKQFNEYLKDNAIDQSYNEMLVGTYECNDDYYRMLLRQMEVAGLVTYDVERYAWWEKSLYTSRESYRVQKYFWGYSYYDTQYKTVKKNKYEFMDHYIVTVALTPKGNKLVIDELPTPTICEDEDLKAPKVDPSKYAWNNVDLTEYWEEIPNPFIEPEEPAEEPVAEAVADSTATDVECCEVDDEEDVDDGIERIDVAQYDRYKTLQCDENNVYLKTFELKGIKARNIQIVNEDGVAKARAEVVVATHNVTDVARIVNGIENDQRVLYCVELQYFYDKGWVLQKVEEIPMALEDEYEEYDE